MRNDKNVILWRRSQLSWNDTILFDTRFHRLLSAFVTKDQRTHTQKSRELLIISPTCRALWNSTNSLK